MVKSDHIRTARTCGNSVNLTKISERQRNHFTICVKNTSNPNFYTILPMEAVRQGFGDTFSLVIAGAGTYGVDMAPAENDAVNTGNFKSHEGRRLLVLWLGMDLGIAVDLCRAEV